MFCIFTCFFLIVPPTVTTKPINKTITEGTKATFYCNATGNPIPKITWVRDGVAVAQGDTLSFETNRNQSGEYWCFAGNGLSPNATASANLDVQCEYTLQIVKPNAPLLFYDDVNKTLPKMATEMTNFLCGKNAVVILMKRKYTIPAVQIENGMSRQHFFANILRFEIVYLY